MGVLRTATFEVVGLEGAGGNLRNFAAGTGFPQAALSGSECQGADDELSRRI